jgi:3-isopropylmalate/(R)-2-methylmalate dehydratase large subunit
MGQTIAEKIISRRAGQTARAGDIAIVQVDGVMATDATAPLAIRAFRAMNGRTLWDSQRVSLVIDHAAPAPNETVANLHKLMRDFAAEMGCRLYDIGEGICHQLMVENGHVKPGDLFLGADSHTPTYGALNAFGVGVGSTDLAAAMLTGKSWLKVPQTIKIVLNGRLPANAAAKDIILFLLRQVGADGANYRAVEFSGEAVAQMSLASRMVLANMSAEMGAKTGLVDPAGLDLWYPFEPVLPGADADYERELTFDVSNLRPQIAKPHAPDNVVDIDELAGTKIQYAFIGSCTNTRLEDLQAAAQVLRGKKLPPGVRLIVAPASKQVFNEALRDGTAAILSEAGATFITSGCGPCVGSHLGVPGDGEVVISSANRNFPGRMGNPKAFIYLASPAVVAASALAGEIVEPELTAGNPTADRRRPTAENLTADHRRPTADGWPLTTSRGRPSAVGGHSRPAHVYAIDNIDTDRIIPGKYTKTLDLSALAVHVLEDLDPTFAATVRPGDILVAGHNFGCGSSREQAPLALKAAGVSAVIARSFARIFYRNAINIGLPVIEADWGHIETGDALAVDLPNGIVTNHTRNESFPAGRMPQQMIDILNAGGLADYLKDRGEY